MRTSVRGSLGAVMLSALSLTAGPATVFGAAPLDDFICYATRGKVAISANLADVLDSGSYTSKGGARVVCTPSDPNSAAIFDPVTHLRGWRIVGPNAPRTNISVQNQFGTFTFDTRPARSLLVPALKSLPPAPAPDPNSDPNGEVDHYRCAFVKISQGTPRFPKGVTVQAADQFATRTAAVKKPLKLCVPTSKNGEGIKHADRQLMCYRAVVKPRTQVAAAQIADQFGVETLKLKKEAELCVPSTASFSPSGAFLEESARPL